MIRDFAKRNNIVDDEHFPVGAQVMMRDARRESKWDPVYEGVFTVVRRNRGGAYVLKDKLGEIIKRTVPADHLKLIKRRGDEVRIDNPSYEIERVTKHRYKGSRSEYFVIWKDKNLRPGWEPVENIDDINIIKQYWKKIRPTRSKR